MYKRQVINIVNLQIFSAEIRGITIAETIVSTGYGIAFDAIAGCKSQLHSCLLYTSCGRCVEACPGRIVPSLLATYAEHFDEESFVEHNGMECCRCV